MIPDGSSPPIWFDKLTMSGDELPLLVSFDRLRTSGGRALETMSVYFLNGLQDAVLAGILG